MGTQNNIEIQSRLTAGWLAGWLAPLVIIGPLCGSIFHAETSSVGLKQRAGEGKKLSSLVRGSSSCCDRKTGYGGRTNKIVYTIFILRHIVLVEFDRRT